MKVALSGSKQSVAEGNLIERLSMVYQNSSVEEIPR
jgi:hypothetical protein